MAIEAAVTVDLPWCPAVTARLSKRNAGSQESRTSENVAEGQGRGALGGMLGQKYSCH